MIPLHEEIVIATHWWCAERDQRNLDHRINRILPFAFLTINSLYIATRQLEPLSQVQTRLPGGQMGGSYGFTIHMPTLPEDYVAVRSVLSLVADLYNLVKPFIKSPIPGQSLLELSDPLQKLYDDANKFRDIRNFFTHIDERISDLDKHGITGATNTNLGMVYTSTAKGYFHLVFDGQKIYFTDCGKAKEIEFSKNAFDSIFNDAKSVYSEIISHSIHQGTYNYAAVGNIFPVS